jgi:hypothetical protein
MNTFVPPFKVHICWFRSADDERCPVIARELYEFLHRPLDDDFVLRPGIDIPVEIGRDLSTLLAKLADGSEPPVGTRLVIALLDSGAFDSAAAHEVIKAAAARWTDVKRDEVFLPLLLDTRWSGELQQSAVEALAGIVVDDPLVPWKLPADVGVVAGRALLRRLDDPDPPRPKVFISHAKVDAATLAEQLAAYMNGDTRVEPWLDKTDIDRGEELGRQLQSATSDGIVLVVRTDRYSESPWCALELLAAKRSRVPIVTLLAGLQGEPSTSAYGGNHRTMTWRDGREGEIVARCVQAWLHGHYFRQYAAAALALAGLPADSEILTRRPELIDIADGGSSRRLLVHPDPPLTNGETMLLRTARPSVRLATPTTLFGRVLLANDPEPPLSGMTLAFSLSNAEELPDFDHAVDKGTGLTEKHLNDVLYSIVTTTVHSGARIAYGGDFRRAGFSEMLSDLLRSRRRLGTTASTQLRAYIRPYKLDAHAVEAKRKIEYTPVHVPIPDGIPPEADDEVQAHVWHLAMRELLTADSQARIVIGGKTKPVSADPKGYFGPWPGVLEEAWRTLRRGGGLFVIGGFSGTGGLIADMLRSGTIPEAFKRATWPGLKPLVDKIDVARAAVLAKTAAAEIVLAAPDGRLYDLEDLATLVLDDWRKLAAQADSTAPVPRWSNGLTKAENERLFVSTDQTEITYLVFEGLRRLARDTQVALKVAAYQGDIALVPDVDAYAVTITPGVPPAGASVAIDKRMGGRLSAIAKEPLKPVTVVASGGELFGSQVLIARLDLGPTGQVTVEEISNLAEAVAREADRLGIASIACAAFGSTLGIELADSAAAMLRGFERAEPNAVRTVVFCENSAGRYPLLRAALGENVVELRAGPVAQRIEQAAVLHVEASEVPEGWKIRSTLFLTDGKDAVVPRAEAIIDAATWSDLRKRARKYDASLAKGNRLWKQVLSEEIRKRIDKYRDRPLVVLTEENGSGLPWEFLTDDNMEQLACRRGVVRRIALKGDAVPPEPEPRASRRVLLVVNPLDDLPNTVIEANDIEAVLRERPDIVVKRLEGAAATRAAVSECLATGTYDVFHYAGHAHFNAADRAQSGLILANGEVLTAADLTSARPPRFVYLSGCESVRVRNEVEVVIEEPENSQSLAEALLRRGVSALVGTFFVVADNTAQTFASATYRKITAGQPLGAAVIEARTQIKTAADWGNFTLYGDDQLII